MKIKEFSKDLRRRIVNSQKLDKSFGSLSKQVRSQTISSKTCTVRSSYLNASLVCQHLEEDPNCYPQMKGSWLDSVQPWTGNCWITSISIPWSQFDIIVHWEDAAPKVSASGLVEKMMDHLYDQVSSGEMFYSQKDKDWFIWSKWQEGLLKEFN